MSFIPLQPGKYLYLATDFHLGTPTYQASRAREDRVVRWLEQITPTCGALMLLGDVFDFWFDYGRVVPKGFVRLQGALARLTDAGIPVTLFTGNHDMWMFDYLPKEIGVQIAREPTTYTIGQKRFMIGHGDGLGPGDAFYKFLKKCFSSRVLQRAFALIHPDAGLRLAQGWSGHSRNTSGHKDAGFKGEAEFLWQWCKNVETKEHHDAYFFGHRHLYLDLPVGERSRYLNLGDWFTDTARYAQIDELGNVEIFEAAS